MIESKSEFSNKKNLFKIEREKTEKEKIQNESEDYFNDLNINNNWKFYNRKLENKNGMALALNEIKKNNKNDIESFRIIKNKINNNGEYFMKKNYQKIIKLL